MLKTKKITDVSGMRVYTDDGFYYGDVEEVILQGNKVYGWRVRATKNSQLSRVLTGARGATVPHQLVKAIGDIVIISRSALPSEELPESSDEMSAEQF